jgi:hypothetical protein
LELPHILIANNPEDLTQIAYPTRPEQFDEAVNMSRQHFNLLQLMSDAWLIIIVESYYRTLDHCNFVYGWDVQKH